MRTEAEIKKGLEICNVGTCGAECPYYGDEPSLCRGNLGKDARSLIAQIREENLALRTELVVNRNSTTTAIVGEPDGNGGYKKLADTLDQTAKQDDGKLDLTLVPTAIIWCIAAIRKFGLTKYKDPMNWKRVEKARLRAAAFRHFLKYLRDPEKLDEESGLPHLWHCATNIDFLCELEHYDIEGCTW